MAAGLQPDRAVIVEPEPDGVSALGEIEGFDRMTGCGPCPAVCEQRTQCRAKESAHSSLRQLRRSPVAREVSKLEKYANGLGTGRVDRFHDLMSRSFRRV